MLPKYAVKKRGQGRYLEWMLDMLQNLLVLLAFIMFLSYVQSSVAATPDTIDSLTLSPSLMSIGLGMSALLLAGLLKWLRQTCLPGR